MTGIRKSFPGVLAVDGVDLEVAPGEIHALLGENGAGKSTLLKILAGAQLPDEGSIELDGRPIEILSPHDAQEQGIVTIYQEFNLVPTLTVAENVFIGREPTRGGWIDWGRMRRETRAIMDRVGLALSPDRLVSDLSVAEQQMVEIAKALAIQSRLIIMDEPTSALAEGEVARLFAICRDLQAAGIAVIFVSHRLDEVKQLCDRLTVLRDGQLVGSAAVADVSIEDIIRMMVGRDVERLFKQRNVHRAGEPALRVEGLHASGDPRDTFATQLRGINLEVRHGEIVGLAGLVGAGRTELARAVFGADRIDAGRVLVEGVPVQPGSPRRAIAAGIGLVPEDRKQQALFLALAVRLNLSIAALDRLCGRLGFIDRGAETAMVEEYRERLNIRMPSADVAVGNLSGGNQQKVVLARWLALQPKVLIVDEPTRGIDVAAKAEVHQLLYELADSGIAVLAISSELPEIMTISDRILTMREGRLTGELPIADATEEKLMQLMTMGRERAA
ncbi:MAG: sugar ABC transporter ATP-binding protein [Geminicoccaceae bacterium]|nr:sugar ABC transporter ATP-binding protein [Geminicoccaceae bacterium]HRY24106.1 sugar ABC transporter ATP-binding protein [Geminicoccaceae bacterium]